MRDKTFFINSIKMDLLRVASAIGDITKESPVASVLEFLNHAKNDFEKVSLSKKEEKLKKEIVELSKTLTESSADPHKRLRWAEKALTIRCQL